MNVRLLRSDDAELAARAIRQIKPPGERQGDTTLRDMERFLDARDVLFAVAVDGEPVGYAVAYALLRVDGGPPMILLYEVMVASGHRRRGVGRALVACVVEAAKAEEAGSMWVLADGDNAAAVALYTSCGACRRVPDQSLFVWSPIRLLS